MKIESRVLLDKLKNQVESDRLIAIVQFQNLSPQILLRPSPSFGWSIAQCLDHLNSYGQYYLPQIQIALKKSNIGANTIYFKSGWLGNYFTRMMDPSTGKKFSAFKGHIPKNDLDPLEVVTRFIEQQELLLKYILESQSIDLNEARIPISISKFVRLKLGDVYQFIIMHNKRHLLQALRNIQPI